MVGRVLREQQAPVAGVGAAVLPQGSLLGTACHRAAARGRGRSLRASAAVAACRHVVRVIRAPVGRRCHRRPRRAPDRRSAGGRCSRRATFFSVTRRPASPLQARRARAQARTVAGRPVATALPEGAHRRSVRRLTGLRRGRARTRRAGSGCGTRPSRRRPYSRAAESPVFQLRACSGLSHQLCRAACTRSLTTGQREVGVVGAGVAEDEEVGLGVSASAYCSWKRVNARP